MAGFEDDFGEMVGGKEAQDTGGGDDLLSEDPAAEFLAREQEQLGELETELAPLAGGYLTPCGVSVHVFLFQFHHRKVPL